MNEDDDVHVVNYQTEEQVLDSMLQDDLDEVHFDIEGGTPNSALLELWTAAQHRMLQTENPDKADILRMVIMTIERHPNWKAN